MIWRRIICNRTSAILVISASLMGVSDLSRADPGTWMPQRDFGQVNAACFRVYKCNTGQDQLIRGDQHIVHTGDQTVWGVCSAGDGAVDSCNDCLTNPPTTSCEWSIQPDETSGGGSDN